MAPESKTSTSMFALDDKNLKDFKFSCAGFLTLVVIIFHYAWIMKQWLQNPDLSTQRLLAHFALFVGTVIGSITVLLKVVYVSVYADDLKEQVDSEKKEQ